MTKDKTYFIILLGRYFFYIYKYLVSFSELYWYFYVFFRKLRRKIGITVQDLGGNAVLGYRQHFDLEGDSGKGIVARGYGTACILSREAPSEITPKISPSPSSVEVMVSVIVHILNIDESC